MDNARVKASVPQACWRTSLKTSLPCFVDTHFALYGFTTNTPDTHRPPHDPSLPPVRQIQFQMSRSGSQALARAMAMKDAVSNPEEFNAHMHRTSDIAGLEEVLVTDLDAELTAAAPDRERIKALFDRKVSWQRPYCVIK